jgi:hypothetical protein
MDFLFLFEAQENHGRKVAVSKERITVGPAQYEAPAVCGPTLSPYQHPSPFCCAATYP